MSRASAKPKSGMWKRASVRYESQSSAGDAVGLRGAVGRRGSPTVGERVSEAIGELVVGRRHLAERASVRREQSHLVAGVRDQQRNVRAVADGDGVDDVIREHDTVVHRRERERGLRVDEAVDRNRLERFDARDAELVHERGGLGDGLVDLAQVEPGATLRDRAMEEPVAHRAR